MAGLPKKQPKQPKAYVKGSLENYGKQNMRKKPTPPKAVGRGK